jgi:hypothetical protein
MDRADPLFEGFCTGDRANSKFLCQGSYCILITKNYGSRYGSASEVVFVVGDGPSGGDEQQPVAASSAAAPGSNPGGTPSPDTPERPTPEAPQVE